MAREKLSKQSTDLRLVVELPEEAQPIVGVTQFQSVLVVATDKALYAAGDSVAVKKFIDGFNLKGEVRDQKENPKEEPPIGNNR